MESIMTSNIPVLDFYRENYLEWKVGVSTYLTASGLKHTVVEGNITTPEAKAKAVLFILHHVDESLKYEFLLIEDPKDLWANLNKRYGSKQSYLYYKAQDEWCDLKFQDFESVRDYNSALCRITSQLKLFGEKYSEEDKLTKTLFTMHPVNTSIQQECLARGYKNHSDLISVLIVYEQTGKLVMRRNIIGQVLCQ